MTPSNWDLNKTVMLLKEGKDSLNINSYRPLTIIGVVSKIFWRIVDQKPYKLDERDSSWRRVVITIFKL